MVYGYGGGVIIRVTIGLVTPGCPPGLRSSVITNGAGSMLLVKYISELFTPSETRTFHRLIWSVVTGGIVSVVVWTVLSIPVDVETRPFERVITFDVFHATSKEVV